MCFCTCLLRHKCLLHFAYFFSWFFLLLFANSVSAQESFVDEKIQEDDIWRILAKGDIKNIEKIINEDDTILLEFMP